MITEEKYKEMQKHRAKLIAENGFLTDYVFPCQGGETQDYDIHTHGFIESYGHPEIQICIGLPQQVAHIILSMIAERVKNGERFEHGHVDHELAENMPAYFIRVNESMLRMIVPDQNGKYLEDDVDGIYKQQYHAHPEQFEILH